MFLTSSAAFAAETTTGGNTMNWNDQVLSKNDIEQLYLDLLNEYGARLPDKQKVVARELFQKLYNSGRSWEWIYWSVWQLGERKIINNTGLFYYEDYKREVDDIAKYANEYIFYNLTMEQFMEDYIQWIALFEKDNPKYNDTIDRIVYFDNKYWNTEEEFTEDEMKELVSLYKNMTKDFLRISKKDYELERRYIAGELRRVYGGVYDVAPHPFVNMNLYQKDITEDERRKGIEIGLYME